MKILRVYAPMEMWVGDINNAVTWKRQYFEEYRLGERATSHPQEFVKDIVYKNGVFTVVFSDNGEWFKSFAGMSCEYQEFSELQEKSNKSKFL